MKSIANSMIYLLVCIVLLVACKSDLATKNEFNSGLYPQYMDTTVRPGDDFNTYVNGSWIMNTPIPNDKSSYGVGYILHEKSQEDVRAIIEESASGDFEEGSDEQKVGDLYTSYMDTIGREALGVKPLFAAFDEIEAIQDITELDAYFAYAGTYGVDVPLGISVYPDFKDPEAYSLYVFQGGLGLPDREYYLSEEGDFPANREAYVDHIQKMHELVGLDDADAAKQIMALETAIAQRHWKKEDNRDLGKMYNVFATDSIDALMPNFDWNAFMKESMADGIEKFVVGQPDFVLGIEELFASFELEVWKKYLRWKIIDDAANRLNQALDDQNFDFYAKILRGIEKPQPRWRRAVSTVNQHLGEVVGKVYVNRHFPPQAKDRMKILVDNLLKAYKLSIQELEWMGDSTRFEALDKLSKFNTKIGYPDKWKDYSDVKIGPNNLYDNIRSSNYAEHKRQLEKLGGPIDKSEWYMSPQTVNAYYSPLNNEIVFPAAILQAPIFDLNADDAVNYGAIGAVIGHEIGHGFDDKGSTFDGDGAMRNWWTDEDREEFKKRTAKLIEQYNGYEAVDSVFVNGEFTQGENIGDLGGLSIALKAYDMSLNGQEPPLMDGWTGVQRVFLGYAQAWRSKRREASTKMMINTDPHAPAKFRVNGIVRNVPQFYEAFDVKEDDSLYLAPEERVKIW